MGEKEEQIKNTYSFFSHHVNDKKIAVRIDTLGTWRSVLYREVSLFQGQFTAYLGHSKVSLIQLEVCPLREIPLYNLYMCGVALHDPTCNKEPAWFWL